MSFDNVRNITSSMFNEAQVFLNFITSQEPEGPMDPTPSEVKIMRGLFYVHTYSAIEKAINELVQRTLLLINSNQVKNNHFTLAFNTISVIDKLQSIRNCSSRNFTNNSISLFQEVGSKSVRQINETVFSYQLQNVWVSTIEEVFGAFGMEIPEIGPREKATINEIVDKRNAVAHGRESASFVGERHRANILREKLQIAHNFTIMMIDEFEDYYENKKFLKPIMKKYYS